VVCGGTEDLVIEDKLIETDGHGVVASATCDVTIRNSRIVAGGYAVVAVGNGEIEIRDSEVEGAKGGLVAIDLGEISYRDTTVRGGVAATRQAELDDDGGNEVTGRVAEMPTTTVILQGGAVKVTTSSVSVPGVEVDASGVRVGGAGGVRVDAAGVQAGGVEVTAAGIRIGGDLLALETVGDFVRLEAAGAVLDAAWRSRASSYSAADTVRLLDELGARVEGGVTHVDLAGDVLFDFGSAAVRSDAAAQLVKVAHVLRQKAQSEVQVIGHTDAVGSDDANQKLSEARAIAVMAWLNQHEGIPADLLKARGLGEKQPIAHNAKPDGSDDPAGRARNRRVEILF
jgi:outer membrane protein OmpA-like peptidoglycan-associated protein